MKTYFVRTRADQTLVGMFCAASLSALARIIESMVEPEDCEYLLLKANEGLFVEAQFVSAPSQTRNTPSVVFLTNTPDEILSADETQSEIDSLAVDLAGVPANSPIRRAMDEVIPPVLEPTDALMDRLQAAEPNGWTSMGPIKRASSRATAPQTRTPILLPNSPGRIH